MPLRLEEITDEALALPSEARVQLADRLVESLDPADDDLIRRLWAEEGSRRLSELRSGAVDGIPGEQAIAELREKYTG
ncbi:MAG: addiction module protein [Verrucomicrobia bacterium]|nr:addiction module protein [Verrucomicrobiota bacterium]